MSTEDIVEGLDKRDLVVKATKFIYAVKSDAFPGLIKIGRTQNVNERVSQLNTACAPSPFVVVTKSPTLNYKRDEKKAHEFFSDQRREGEFFEVDESQVKEFFQTIQELYAFEAQQMSLHPPGLNETDVHNARVGPVLRMLLNGVVHDHKECLAKTAKIPSDDYPGLPLQEDYSVGFKRRREEIELKMLEQEFFRGVEEDLRRISNPDKVRGIEERACILLKDKYFSMLGDANESPGRVTNMASFLDRQVKVTRVAGDFGFEFSEKDIKCVDEDLERRYKERHGKPPQQFDVWCDNDHCMTATNFYTERDRDLVERSVREYFNPWLCASSN